MVDIEKKKNIFRLYFFEKKSLRYISSELNIHRDTVRKYVCEFQDELEVLCANEEEFLLSEDEIVNRIVKKSVYDTSSRKIIDEKFLEKVEGILSHNKNSSIVSMYRSRENCFGEVYFPREFGLTTFYKAAKMIGYKKAQKKKKPSYGDW